MYEKSMDIIFNSISARLNKRKKEMNIRSKDLIPDNPTLSSAILHNRKDPKKNPYLIPNGQISPIMNSLNFKSKKELLFGTDEEIKSYAYSLFHALIIDTLEMDKDDKLKAIKKYGKKYDYDIFDKLESTLIDYVPYALKTFYVENRANQELADYMIPYEILVLVNEGTHITEYAVERLYTQTYSSFFFINSFIDNIVKRDTVVRLDKAFLDFVIVHLLPLLIDQMYDDKYSLGNRAYKALTGLISEWESLKSNTLFPADRIAYYRTIFLGLMKASFEYALNLCKLQNQIEHPYSHYNDYKEK